MRSCPVFLQNSSWLYFSVVHLHVFNSLTFDHRIMRILLTRGNLLATSSRPSVTDCKHKHVSYIEPKRASNCWFCFTDRTTGGLDIRHISGSGYGGEASEDAHRYVTLEKIDFLVEKVGRACGPDGTRDGQNQMGPLQTSAVVLQLPLWWSADSILLKDTSPCSRGSWDSYRCLHIVPKIQHMWSSDPITFWYRPCFNMDFYLDKFWWRRSAGADVVLRSLVLSANVVTESLLIS